MRPEAATRAAPSRWCASSSRWCTAHQSIWPLVGALCGGGGMVVAQATSVAIFAAKTHWQVGQPAAALYSMARLAPAVWVESLVNDLSSYSLMNSCH